MPYLEKALNSTDPEVRNRARTIKQRIVDGPSADLHGSLDTLDRIAAFARSEPTVLLPAHDPLAEHRLAERITLTD